MQVVVSGVDVDRIGPPELERFWTILSRTERAEADRVSDRRTLICARALVRLALSAEVPAVAPEAWSFARDDAGKPRIVAPVAPMGDRLDFNLSHTVGLAICAVASGPVGVDAEALAAGPSILDTVVQIFAPAEVAALRALDPAGQLRRAVELWTVKEAYLKGLGTGIGRRLGSFTVAPCGGGRWRVDEDERWSLAVVEYGRFLVAVAALGPLEGAISVRDML